LTSVNATAATLRAYDATSGHFKSRSALFIRLADACRRAEAARITAIGRAVKQIVADGSLGKLR
jgi:hypothetical protein